MNKLHSFALVVATYCLSSIAQAATVSFASTPVNVVTGQTFTLDLVGTDFNNGTLDGGGLNIGFDSSVITVTSVSVNTVDWEFFSTDGTIDNSGGSVNGITFNSFETRTGNLLFATVEFLAVGEGSSALSLSEFNLNPFASGGSAYTGLAFDQLGSVNVSAVPVPAAAWLFGSALVGLAGVKRRK